jgi:hypothetical protein
MRSRRRSVKPVTPRRGHLGQRSLERLIDRLRPGPTPTVCVANPDQMVTAAWLLGFEWVSVRLTRGCDAEKVRACGAEPAAAHWYGLAGPFL